MAHTGDPDTDEILNDPEIMKRLLDSKAEYEGLNSEEVSAKIAQKLANGELLTQADVVKKAAENDLAEHEHQPD